MTPEMDTELNTLLSRLEDAIRDHENAVIAEEHRFEISKKLNIINAYFDEIKALIDRFIEESK